MNIRHIKMWPVLLVLATILYVYRIDVFGINVSLFRIIYALWLAILVRDVLLRRIRWRAAYAIYAAMFFSIALLNCLDLLRMSNVDRYGRDVIGHLINLSLVGLVILYFDNEQKIEQLLRVFSWCSLTALAIAIFSVYTDTIPFEEVLRTNKTDYVVQGEFIIYYQGALRLASSFYDPNFYGLYLCFVIVFCFYLIYFNRASWIYRGILMSALVALFLTLSRTAFVGLTVIALVTVLKIRRSWGLIGSLFIAGSATLIVLALFSRDLGLEWNILERITDSESVIDRFSYIQNGLEAFQRSFVFGSGTESLVSEDNMNPSAHLVYLSWLAKYGLVGFACYAFFIFYPLIYVYSQGRRLHAKFRYLITATYAALVVMYLAYDYFAILEFQYLVFGIVYSIILNRIGLEGEPLRVKQTALANDDHKESPCAAS